MKLDLLAIAAHPDDLELTCGGTLAKLAKAGYKVGALDATRGESGTRGTPKTRQKEAQDAAKILGLAVRDNLGIQDANVQVTRENELKIIRAFRKYQPTLVICPYLEDRHPDHAHVGQLVTNSQFLSGLRKLDPKTGDQAHRPECVLHYFGRYDYVKPSFIVDISDTFEIKMAAIKTHSSQFHNPNSNEPETILSDPEFFNMIEMRARYWGRMIDVPFGEPFHVRRYLHVPDAETLFKMTKMNRP